MAEMPGMWPTGLLKGDTEGEAPQWFFKKAPLFDITSCS